MRRLFILPGIVIIAMMLAGQGNAGDFGLGAIMGDPTGISGKVWTGRATAVDFAAAWSTTNDRAFHFHMTYLMHDYGVFNVSKGKLPLYYGIGGRIIDAEDPILGLRGPIGINYLFARTPLDLFLEIAPVLNLSPSTDLDFDAGAGIRFYFR